MYSLDSLYQQKNCDILVAEEGQNVILRYQNDIVEIPYEQWKNLEEYILSYFQFQLQKLIKEHV